MEQPLGETNNQQVRQMNLAWLAGLWEGEGSFSIVSGGNSRWYPRAIIINTDFMLIEEVARILTELGVGHYIQLRKNGCDGDPRHKDAKQLHIYGAKRTSRFIELILPHLRGKKREVACAVQEFIKRRLSAGKKQYDSKDLELVTQVRELNKKGPSVTSETTRQPSPYSASEDIVQVV